MWTSLPLHGSSKQAAPGMELIKKLVHHNIIWRRSDLKLCCLSRRNLSMSNYVADLVELEPPIVGWVQDALDVGLATGGKMHIDRQDQGMPWCWRATSQAPPCPWSWRLVQNLSRHRNCSHHHVVCGFVSPSRLPILVGLGVERARIWWRCWKPIHMQLGMSKTREWCVCVARCSKERLGPWCYYTWRKRNEAVCV
jgi:hypothetical protein